MSSGTKCTGRHVYVSLLADFGFGHLGQLEAYRLSTGEPYRRFGSTVRLAFLCRHQAALENDFSCPPINLLKQAAIVPHHEMAVDLLYHVECHTDGNQ